MITEISRHQQTAFKISRVRIHRVVNESTHPIPVRLYGQLHNSMRLEKLVTVLSPTFPTVQIRESAHFVDGRYVKIPLEDHDRICFERCSDTEYLVSGDCDDSEILLGTMAGLTKALEESDVIHRLEVYQEDELLGATAYRWEVTESSDEQAGVPMIEVSQCSRIGDVQEEIKAEIASDLPHDSPRCGGKNYRH